VSRNWDEIRAEAEAAGKLNPRRPERRKVLLRDLDRRNATYAEPAKDWSHVWLFAGIALALAADVVLAVLAANLIIGAAS
jgi:hypothetical protein